MVYYFNNSHFILKKIIYIIQILILVIFIPSCGLNKKTISLENTDNKIFYTVEEYKKIHKSDFGYKDDVKYIGLRLEDFKLLDKPYNKATKNEIRNDIAYNRKPILLDKKYTNIIDYLSEDKNLIKLVMNLNYKKKNIKSIVFTKNKAIILLVGSSSYESFLVGMDENFLRIKLIDYLYGCPVPLSQMSCPTVPIDYPSKK